MARTKAKGSAMAETVKKLALGLGFETVETRKSDRLDFHEVAVWSAVEALEAAYKAGAASSGGAAATYPVKRRDGSTVRVTVPPRACQACGGEGCARCKASDGYEPGEA